MRPISTDLIFSSQSYKNLNRLSGIERLILLHYQITKLCILCLFLSLVLVPKSFGSDFCGTNYPLQLSDGTSIPDPFSTQTQLNQRISDIRKKYEPFTKNLVSPPPYFRSQMDITKSDWLFREDPQAIGEAQKWFLKDTDTTQWSKQPLPDFHQFALGWYRTTFSAPTWSADRMILRFDGVDYSTRVFLNGHYIGQHNSYITGFEFDVTGLINPGENILALRVDNPQCWDGQQDSFQGEGMGTVAFNPDRKILQFSNAAGIFQPVKLIGRSNIHVENLKILPKWPETVRVDVKIVNTTGQEDCDFELELIITPRNFDGNETILKQNTRVTKETTEAVSCKLPNVRYWTPDTPFLYNARVIIKDKSGKILDCIDESFGMRWLSQKQDGTFLLNNEPFYFRGSGSFGTFWPAAVQQDADKLIHDILIFKAANLNMTRPHLHVLPKFFYQYADMYGLMIYLDMPLNSSEGFGGNLPNNPDILPAYVEEMKRQYAELSNSLFNHPSIAIWQFINESQIFVPATQIPPALKELVRFSREIDPTRLVCSASGFTAIPGFPTNPNREWWGISDIHWYAGVLLQTLPYLDYWPKTPNKSWEFTPNDKKIVTEYGIPAYPNWETWAKSFPWEITPDARDLYDIRNIPKEEPVYRGTTFLGDVMILEHITRYIGDCARPLDWIQRTQDYQAYIVKDTTDALRRRPDINGYVHFYLTNPGPLTFGSAVVDNERIAHKAYFALAQASEPLRVSIQYNGRRFFGGSDLKDINAWIYNDTKEHVTGNIKIILADQDGKIISEQTEQADVSSATPQVITLTPFKLPEIIKEDRQQFFIYSILTSNDKILAYDCLPIEIFKKEPAAVDTQIALYDKLGKTALAFEEGGIKFKKWIASEPLTDLSLLVIGAYSSDSELANAKKTILEFIEKGGCVLVLNQTYPGQASSAAFSSSENLSPNWHLEKAVTISGNMGQTSIPQIPCDLSWMPFSVNLMPTERWRQTCYAQRLGKIPFLKNIQRNDMFTWNGGNGLVVEYPIDMLSNEETLLTCSNWQNYTAVLLKKIGQGKLLFSQLILTDRYGTDPIATRIFDNMLNVNNWQKAPELSITKSAAAGSDANTVNIELTVTNTYDSVISGDVVDSVLQDRLSEPNLQGFRERVTLNPGEKRVLKFTRTLNKFTGDLSPAVFFFDDGLWVCSNQPAIGVELDKLEKIKTFDFGTNDSPLAPGATRVTPLDAYAQEKEFGWDTNITMAAVVRSEDPILTDFHSFNRTEDPRTFNIKLPKGNYYFRLIVGDTAPSEPELYLFDVLPPQIVLCNQKKVGRLVRLIKHQKATLTFAHQVADENITQITLKPLYPRQVIAISGLEIYKTPN